MGKRLGIDAQDVAVGKDVGAGRLHGGRAQAAAPVRLGDVVAELGGAPVDVRPARGAYRRSAQLLLHRRLLIPLVVDYLQLAKAQYKHRKSSYAAH